MNAQSILLKKEMSIKRQHTATFIGLFVSLGFPFILNLLFGRGIKNLAMPSRVVLVMVEEWAVVLVLLGIVRFWEGKFLSSIGIRKMSGRDLLCGVMGFVIGALSFIVTTSIVNILGLGTTSGGILQLAQVPIALRIGVVITAGITEEIMFRGYPIERLNSLTGRLNLSAIVTYLVFVLLHIPFWGLGGAIQIGVWSLIITALYIKRRNLPACMLMHILNDFSAFILLPPLFA